MLISKQGSNDFGKILYSAVMNYEKIIGLSRMFQKIRLVCNFGVAVVKANFI